MGGQRRHNSSIKKLLTAIREGQLNCSDYCQEALSQSSISDPNASLYKGKVRDVVMHSSGDVPQWVEIFHSDRLSAFDCHIGYAPLRGIILANLSYFWLKQCSAIMPTYIDGVDNPVPIGRILKGRYAKPVKAEVIVRGYLAGSLAREYEKGSRTICGINLPDGLESFSKLPQPIVTPTTKAEAYQHDENISAQQLIAQGIATESEWSQMHESALKMFALGQRICGAHGWILADTKYEFGRAADGSLLIIDEVHTPDSSRLWRWDEHDKSKVPQMFDKENVRRYLMEHGFSGKGAVPEVPAEILAELSLNYLEVAESILEYPLKFTQDT